MFRAAAAATATHSEEVHGVPAALTDQVHAPAAVAELPAWDLEAEAEDSVEVAAAGVGVAD